MNETLIQMIESAFGDVELGDEYTLLEEDFYDYGGIRRHFDQLGSDPFKVYIGVDLGIEFSQLRQDILDVPYWPESSKHLALTALETRQKAVNPYDSWKDVTYEYLDAHRAVAFLSPKAFQNYLPAAMIIFIISNQSYPEYEFMNSFEFYLTYNPTEYIKLFNTDQLLCVCKFLEICDYPSKEEIDSTIKKIKLKLSNMS